MSRRVAILAGLVLVALLAGCGGSADDISAPISTSAHCAKVIADRDLDAALAKREMGRLPALKTGSAAAAELLARISDRYDDAAQLELSETSCFSAAVVAEAQVTLQNVPK